MKTEEREGGGEEGMRGGEGREYFVIMSKTPLFPPPFSLFLSLEISMKSLCPLFPLSPPCHPLPLPVILFPSYAPYPSPHTPLPLLSSLPPSWALQFSLSTPCLPIVCHSSISQRYVLESYAGEARGVPKERRGVIKPCSLSIMQSSDSACVYPPCMYTAGWKFWTKILSFFPPPSPLLFVKFSSYLYLSLFQWTNYELTLLILHDIPNSGEFL